MKLRPFNHPFSPVLRPPSTAQRPTSSRSRRRPEHLEDLAGRPFRDAQTSGPGPTAAGPGRIGHTPRVMMKHTPRRREWALMSQRRPPIHHLINAGQGRQARQSKTVLCVVSGIDPRSFQRCKSSAFIKKPAISDFITLPKHTKTTQRERHVCISWKIGLASVCSFVRGRKDDRSLVAGRPGKTRQLVIHSLSPFRVWERHLVETLWDTIKTKAPLVAVSSMGMCFLSFGSTYSVWGKK